MNDVAGPESTPESEALARAEFEALLKQAPGGQNAPEGIDNLLSGIIGVGNEPFAYREMLPYSQLPAEIKAEILELLMGAEVIQIDKKHPEADALKEFVEGYLGLAAEITSEKLELACGVPPKPLDGEQESYLRDDHGEQQELQTLDMIGEFEYQKCREQFLKDLLQRKGGEEKEANAGHGLPRIARLEDGGRGA